MGVKKMQMKAMNFTSYNPRPKTHFFLLLLVLSFGLDLSLISLELWSCGEETKIRRGRRKGGSNKGERRVLFLFF
jgi:hypothetical protein